MTKITVSNAKKIAMKFFRSEMTPPPFKKFPEIHPFWRRQASLIIRMRFWRSGFRSAHQKRSSFRRSYPAYTKTFNRIRRLSLQSTMACLPIRCRYKHNNNFVCLSDFNFCGKHFQSFQAGQKNIILIVMNNLFPSQVTIHLKFDLKGSTHGRKVFPILIC